ncbi:MAG: S8 family serine peptidase [Sphingopyxis sp.]
MKKWWAICALGVFFMALSPNALASAEPEDREDRATEHSDAREDRETESHASEDHAPEDHEGVEGEEGEESDENEEGDHDRASAASIRELTQDEHPEFDDDHFPVVPGEVIGLDLSENALTAAAARGFHIIETTRLAELESTVTRLMVPTGVRVSDAAAMLRQIDPHATISLSHYYATPASGPGRSRPTRVRPPEHRPDQRAAPLRIGMIDSAVEPHPMLNRASVTRGQFGNNATDSAGHGTAVASVLAHNGATELLAANVFRGNGRQFTSPDAIIRGLSWLIGQHVSVINISLAGPRNPVLDALFSRALTNGHVIVAAAGNGGPTSAPAYPAALDGVVAVTAVDAQNRIYRYANRGDYVRVAAPGVAIMTAAPRGMQRLQSGTSFAAPYIATILARCATRVSTSNSRCITNMERTAIDLGAPGRDPIYGLGLVTTR